MPDKEEIRQRLEKEFNERTNLMTVITGSGGAKIMHECILIKSKEDELGRKLNKKELSEIENQLNNEIFEPGEYLTNDMGMKYNGLFIEDHDDGTFLARVGELWYIEKWKNGKRVDFKIIPEEEVEKIKRDGKTDAKWDFRC